MKKKEKKKKIVEYENVASLDDIKKENIYLEIKKIIDELIEDGGEVSLTDPQLRTILSEFYQYYQKKGILFCFEEAMVEHFEDIADDAYYEAADFDLEYVLGELALYELVDSRVEVNPKDTKKLVKGIRKQYK